MYSLLLVIIYIAFISLGLPDSLIGSAWPIMHRDLQVPVSSPSCLLCSAFWPPVFGLLAAHVSIGLYPVYLLLFGGLMLFMSERLRRKRG